MEQVAFYLPGILLAYSAFLLSIMSPGPNVLAILGTSMSGGRRPGSALALGVATGSLCWAALTVAGLSTLLTAYAEALLVIKIIGGLYLLWLAYKSFRAAIRRQDLGTKTFADTSLSPFGYYLRGFTIQMTNPKAALAWIAIISLGLQPDAPLWVGLLLVIGTGLLSAGIHLLYALAFSTTGVLRLYGKARRWIQATLAAFFCFAGVKLLMARL